MSAGQTGPLQFYSRSELEALGLTRIGDDVSIHRSVILINPAGISIRDHVRIDCHSLVSAGEAGIEIGSYVHVAAGCYLFGGGGRILLSDFSGLSSRVSIYTASDDYVHGHLTNPTVPDEFRDVTRGDVILKPHVIVGASSVILPGVELGFGAAVGALTCVRKDVAEGHVVAGTAARARQVAVRDLDRLRSLEQQVVSSCEHESRQAGRSGFDPLISMKESALP